MRPLKVLFLVMICVLWAGVLPAHAAKRVALVIGNSGYRSMPPLANPKNDAELMAATLKHLGFEVHVSVDADRRAMGRAVRSFGKALRAAGKDAVGLFYYAGHGIQARGVNYLVPLAAEIEGVADLEVETLSAANVLAQMEEAGNALNLVILDACRNNPLKGKVRSASRGLARISAASGTLIAFAAAPGQVAADGEGKNSPYTFALSKAMRQPGLTVEQMFKRVRVQVEDQTGGAQTPWEESSLRGDFFFAGRGASATAPVTLQPAQDLAALQTRLKELEDRLKKQTEQPKGEPRVAIGIYPEKPKAGRQYNPGDEFQDCDQCPKMVVLPAGSFMMGSPKSEKERDETEGPRHKVRIPQAFAVGKFEVTFAEWDACVADGSCGSYRPDDKGWGRGRRPVIIVGWEDARTYVAWLARKTGKPYRLLSEAEWEYAARAGTTTPFSTGQRITTKQANFNGDYTYHGARLGRSGIKTFPVGSFAKNAFGLHDMHGNVWEWVEDCWNDSYRSAPSDGRSRTRGDCSQRVLRGGSWDYEPKHLRSAFRIRTPSGYRSISNGFRVARTLTPNELNQ